MTEKIIVLVRDRQDEKHGEISVLDDPEKAERLVEALLEAGFDRDRIQVFMGQTSEFQVSHRPVVALREDAEEMGEASQPPLAAEVPEELAAAPQEQTLEEETAAAEPPQEPAESHPSVFKRDDEPAAEKPDAEAAEAQEAQDADSQEEEEEKAEPVRFSSLFRSA